MLPSDLIDAGCGQRKQHSFGIRTHTVYARFRTAESITQYGVALLRNETMQLPELRSPLGPAQIRGTAARSFPLEN